MKFLWHIVRLHFDHYWSCRRIASALTAANGQGLISPTQVARVVRRFNETGDVRTPSRGQRRRESTMLPVTWWYLVQVLDMQSDLYLDDMQELPPACVIGTSFPADERSSYHRDLRDDVNASVRRSTNDPGRYKTGAGTTAATRRPRAALVLFSSLPFRCFGVFLPSTHRVPPLSSLTHTRKRALSLSMLSL
jgi:hypothetical protein